MSFDRFSFGAIKKRRLDHIVAESSVIQTPGASGSRARVGEAVKSVSPNETRPNDELREMIWDVSCQTIRRRDPPSLARQARRPEWRDG